ncbi:predicted protein [Streptomyces viridosporus ATCC 14672]|uniref:Predicted protein n=1 Tax=Streptomyces viridosporus (strain ATCC 14672 / DSM 40746 / JCM 4963 / KCTC 9882 / NRRL B-12104 / FH 1290) TaxID=566461 RepID=D6A206_STRV1|nr:predicted protein [Streptomyces viridosporus ATCC 14672]
MWSDMEGVLLRDSGQVCEEWLRVRFGWRSG